VDLSHYPDPYVGDLRGLRGEPRLVLLGLNPGIGYDQLQGANGKWTQRIAEVGYSHCFDRSPEDDLASWIELHGKRSPYWVKIVYFAQRWLDDTAATARDIFNIELFPWHSPSKNSAMSVPADIIQRYVWAPIGELPVSEVFGFGVDWFRVCEQAGLPRVALFGHGGQPIPALPINKAKWRIGMYRLPSGQIVVASAQSGSSNPPGLERVGILRQMVAPMQ
jgi:hypothetical protein